MEHKLPKYTIGNTLYHIIAIFTVCIWGLTFVSTKTLINHGLSPTEIFLYRFLIAYLCILPIAPKPLFSNNLKDESLLMLCGLCGGTLYFITENSALSLTFASNVSLLICTASIFTMLLGNLIYKFPLQKGMLSGSFIALCGVAMVVFNGSITHGINPLGDFLTIIAAISWAVYSLLLKRLGTLYPTLFITRKVFFYGLTFVMAYILITATPINIYKLTSPTVFFTLLFLGIMASMLCYIMWNIAVKKLGAEKTSNYIYCVPLITIIASVLFLSEPFTTITLFGTICIIGGVYLAER